jgi:hypothetical protein
MPANKLRYTFTQNYAVVVARCIDILVAGWLWREYDITISAHCGLEMRKPNPSYWARALNAFLNFLERGHCELAIACDTERSVEARAILGSWDVTVARLDAIGIKPDNADGAI